MREDCLKIIDHYGINHQQRKLAEEVFELQEAITKHEFTKGDNKTLEELGETKKWDTYFFKNNVVEELADVMVLLRQFQAYYNIETEQLGTIMYDKIQRTLKRMEKDNGVHI